MFFKSFLLNRTKYETRDKQQQGRVATLEKEKNSLRDELTNTVNELTQVRVLLDSGALLGFFKAGVALCQNEGTHQIVVSFSPPVVGCLLKRGLQNKGGSRAPRTPRTPSLLSYAPGILLLGVHCVLDSII